MEAMEFGEFILRWFARGYLVALSVAAVLSIALGDGQFALGALLALLAIGASRDAFPARTPGSSPGP
jgi:hypothetical protein